MNIKLADRLVQLRKENGYSQEALAEKLGLSRQSISKWERAEASPDTDNLVALAKIYGVSLDELIGAAEPEKAEESEKAEKKKAELNAMQLKGKKLLKIFPVFTLIIVALFVAVGFATGYWHPAWLLFLLIPLVLTAALSLILGKSKRIAAMLFTSTVALIAVILFLAAGLFLDAWAVAWVVFLAIPIYAYIAFLKTK